MQTDTNLPSENTNTPNQENPQPTPKSNKTLIIILVCSIGAIILLALAIIGGVFALRQFAPNAIPSLTTANDGNSTVTEQESSIASVAEKVGPSVVSIVTQTRSRSMYGTLSGAAAGTGIIVSKDGYVMTNNHVLESATDVSNVYSTGE